MKIQLLAALMGLLFVNQAIAHGQRSQHDDSVSLKACYSQHKNQGHGGGNSQNHGGVKATPVSCGDVITQSITIANDLNCASETGFALTIVGDNIKVDAGHHVIYAPQAIAGFYIQGSNVSLTNAKVNGITEGAGVFAYDSPGLQLSQNDFSNNQVGINLYAENTVMKGITVSNNTASSNSLFGIRTGQDGLGSIVDPTISGNDFSNSGSYAMLIQAAHDDLGSCERNDLSNSLNGIYLKDGVFNVHDFSLTRDNIQRISIFVDSAVAITVSNLDLSTNLSPDPTQERMGLDLYRVLSFSVKGLTSSRTDVGLKLETEKGANSSGSATGCSFSNNGFAGIMISSYDSTQYGLLNLTHNQFCEKSASISSIFTTVGTIWKAL